MKFELFGQIKSRTVHHVTPKREGVSPYDIYQLEIEEPGKYPSTFKVQTKDASMFGQKDGMFAVGKMATVRGFVNGRVSDVQKKDGGTFRRYDVNLTVTEIISAEPSDDPAPAGAAAEEISDDLPF